MTMMTLTSPQAVQPGVQHDQAVHAAEHAGQAQILRAQQARVGSRDARRD